ncbi:MAG TPA: polysaccharide deacetylase [Gemmatimonadaceae bacterium]|jgi:peptidoglycan/xylan/chitin deacetylase (PgdA/CDA1 family)
MRKELIVVVLSAGLTSTALAQADTTPPWMWSTERVKQTIGMVRAGKSLAPKQWPGGARVAVLLSFDVDNETVFLAPIAPGRANIGGLSQGEYGARVGLKRVLALLEKQKIPASFFMPAMSLELHPEIIPMIKAAGHHEFGVHGWIHELNSTLPAAAERDLVRRAVEYFEKATGAKPVGYRAPSWNFSPSTLSIIRELGLIYDSSLMSDDSPYELMADGQPTGIVELPVEWINDDAPLLNPRGDRYSAPDQLLKVWMDEFDKAYEEGTNFVLTMHPHIIGHRSRIVLLERLIAHMKTKPGVWFGTHRAAVEYVKAQARMM